ncbi:MAG: phenylalanine--tRNA ligase subunit beta [Clostridia bacterium]|nr:phenylalanine--tRNA ligase subunit beta [Clostridia bacterium]
MDLSKRWLHDYVDIDVTDQEFADGMTLSGSKVEAFCREGKDIKNVIVGKVESLERHPDSDHLWICQINVGQAENIQIVTGAQNLKEGDVVPVAMHDSFVAGGNHIKKGKLRGVESNGMLCSLGELGLTKHDFPYAIEDGIFVLGDDCDKTLGMDIHEAIGLDDIVTEFEITSNRADCLSVTGLAREAAATFGGELKLPVPEVKNTHGNVNDFLKVDIDEPSLCYRYSGAVVENVRIKPSPRWMRERLRASGVRPINNIVDITNYVMLEFGQPMHAFDLRYLDGNHVIVRRAKSGEKITTLDGIERELSDTMLVIADENKPVAVAGVMGGEYSGIMDDTTTIVFESAMFNGVQVRRTAKALGMRTESSARYEKELDATGCVRSLTRALQLVEELDAGDIVGGIIDCDRSDKTPVTLPFKPEWVNSFIGIDLSADEQKKILEKIDFKVEDGIITAPSFRNDIEHQADISEEIARFYGYNKIPDRVLSGVADGRYTDEQTLENKLHSVLTAQGLDEICTYTFISPKEYDKLTLAEDDKLRSCIVISNPLGEDTSVMRTTAIPSMLSVLSRNYNNRNASAALYEIAPVYLSNGTEELPDEPDRVMIGLYGEEHSYFTLKGIVEKVLECAGISGYDVQRVSDSPIFHPGRTAKIVLGEDTLATLGEIHPKVRENYSIGTRCYVAEISFDLLFKNRGKERVYTPLPKFPAVTRDLAVVCDKTMAVLTLEKAIRAAIGKTLDSITLFDVYDGAQVGFGKKSVAFSLKLLSKERTLTDEDADSSVKKAIKALEELGCSLRS